MYDRCRKVRAVQRRLLEERQPAGPADIALACDLNPIQVEEALRISRVTTSLDVVVADGANLGDFLFRYDHITLSPEAAVLSKLRSEWIKWLFNTMPERSAHIMRHRFGFIDDNPWTLDEIGTHLGLTRERIRQIESKEMTSLRNLVDHGSRHSKKTIDSEEDSGNPKLPSPRNKTAGPALGGPVTFSH
jgi:RNA polymerase primary sigma factor